MTPEQEGRIHAAIGKLAGDGELLRGEVRLLSEGLRSTEGRLLKRIDRHGRRLGELEEHVKGKWDPEATGNTHIDPAEMYKELGRLDEKRTRYDSMRPFRRKFRNALIAAAILAFTAGVSALTHVDFGALVHSAPKK